MQMSLISLTRKPGVLCTLQTMCRASPAGPGRLQDLHSDGRALDAGTTLREPSVLDSEDKSVPSVLGKRSGGKEKLRAYRRFCHAEAAFLLNQQCSILPGAGGSFSPRVSRSIPTSPRNGRSLLFLPSRGRTNKRAEKWQKSGTCPAPHSLQSCPLSLAAGFPFGKPPSPE